MECIDITASAGDTCIATKTAQGDRCTCAPLSGDCRTCSLGLAADTGAVQGATCSQCRNSKYLYQGECLATCPPGTESLGTGTYGRYCRAFFMLPTTAPPPLQTRECQGFQVAGSADPVQCHCGSLFPNCRNCTQTRVGDKFQTMSCSMCKGSQYLYRGRCLAECPAGTRAEGTGVFGRTCHDVDPYVQSRPADAVGLTEDSVFAFAGSILLPLANTLSISFKTNKSYGVLFYAAGAQTTDFLAIELVAGRVMLRVNAGGGEQRLFSRQATYSDNQFHRLHVQRIERHSMLSVDGRDFNSGVTSTGGRSLDNIDILLVGTSSSPTPSPAFVGCVGGIAVDHTPLTVDTAAVDLGLIECEVSGCDTAPCLNGGVCRAGANDTLFSCDCTSDFIGATCMTPTSVCSSPDVCSGRGTCVPLGIDSYLCECDLGFVGENCSIMHDPPSTDWHIDEPVVISDADLDADFSKPLSATFAFRAASGIGAVTLVDAMARINASSDGGGEALPLDLSLLRAELTAEGLLRVSFDYGGGHAEATLGRRLSDGQAHEFTVVRSAGGGMVTVDSGAYSAEISVAGTAASNNSVAWTSRFSAPRTATLSGTIIRSTITASADECALRCFDTAGCNAMVTASNGFCVLYHRDSSSRVQSSSVWQLYELRPLAQSVTLFTDGFTGCAGDPIINDAAFAIQGRPPCGV